jgi:hypothetical protein
VGQNGHRAKEISRYLDHTGGKTRAGNAGLAGSILLHEQPWKLFKAVSPSEEMDFPILTGLSKKDPDQKEKLDQTAQVLNVLRGEEDLWSLQNLSEIHLTQNGGNFFIFQSFSGRDPYFQTESGTQYGGAETDGTKHLNESGKISLVTQIDLNHVDGAIVSFKKNQV